MTGIMQSTIAPAVAASATPTYIGSVSKQAASEADFDTPAEALDVLGVAQDGDLVVIAFSFDVSADSTWSWGGMPFGDIVDGTGTTIPGYYVGYRIVRSGDTNPYVTGVTEAAWQNLSIVASVFRGPVLVAGDASASSGILSGMPNPPLLFAYGSLWVSTGHLDDDIVTDWGAPTAFTLAASEATGTPGNGSSTAIAYYISDQSGINPSPFTGSGDDSWHATTAAFR